MTWFVGGIDITWGHYGPKITLRGYCSLLVIVLGHHSPSRIYDVGGSLVTSRSSWDIYMISGSSGTSRFKGDVRIGGSLRTSRSKWMFDISLGTSCLSGGTF